MRFVIPLKRLWLLLAGWLALVCGALAAGPPPGASADAVAVFNWVVGARDNGALPFMIIDKRRAHLWVFDRSGQLQGDSPVLLGVARGDHTAPGIGSMKLADIRHEDRTTPAGRFVGEVGENARGEDVVWVDYDSGVSMHRVLTINPKERRVERLATPTPSDNRVSFGCINVPKRFFETVLTATVNRGNSIVYVLPETRPLHSVFGQVGAAPPAAASSGTPRTVAR